MVSVILMAHPPRISTETHRDAITVVAVPSLPEPGLGRRAVMALSLAASVPSGASSCILWLGFGSALRPEGYRGPTTGRRGEERQLSLIVIRAEV